MRTPYYESTIHRQIREKREDRKKRVRYDLQEYGREVLASDEIKQAFNQTHHQWSTVGEHTFRVAFSSVMICYALKKLNIKVNVPAVVIGALCHDLGMLGRSDRYASDREAVAEHAKESVTVAREIVSELPEKTEDIIERHMWPLGDSKAPNSIEGAVVSVADKYNAVKDVVKGSEVMNTGVKNYVKNEKEKIQEVLQKEITLEGAANSKGKETGDE